MKMTRTYIHLGFHLQQSSSTISITAAQGIAQLKQTKSISEWHKASQHAMATVLSSPRTTWDSYGDDDGDFW
jgi:hypothetical protein